MRPAVAARPHARSKASLSVVLRRLGGRRHALDDVLAVHPAVVLVRVHVERVVSLAAVDDVDAVVVREGVHRVVAGPAELTVGAAADPDHVVALAALDDVVAVAPAQEVVARAAPDHVVTRTPEHAVVPAARLDHVVPGARVHVVVAVERRNEVVPREHADRVVAGRPAQRVRVRVPLTVSAIATPTSANIPTSAITSTCSS